MRVAVLWTRLSGYLNACLHELASRPGVELLVAHDAAHEDAPFDDSQFAWMSKRIKYGARIDRDALLDETSRFAPDVVLVSSWHIREFRHVLQRLRPRPLRVLCMDNQWRGTWKQRLGAAGARWYVLPHYEAVFLPGERQACFARRLGFSDNQIWQGLLCPDSHVLSEPTRGLVSPLQRSFGYLGRLSREKGIQDLLEAYGVYRATSTEPWDLRVAGAGPLRSELNGHPGVVQSGFIESGELGAWMDAVGCLVVPSRSEAWGVVISEAAWAGRPIIATDACGAAPHLVHDFANGRVARTGDIRSIAGCMEYIAQRSDDERMEMGRVSRALATPYSPVRWADTLLGRTAEHRIARDWQ